MDQPTLLIDIWKTLRELSQQMGAVVATTAATGGKVDGLDERLQQVEKCVQTIPALEGRVVALEGKVGKTNGNGKKPAWERVVRWCLVFLFVGAVLILGYVELVKPLLK